MIKFWDWKKVGKTEILALQIKPICPHCGENKFRVFGYKEEEVTLTCLCCRKNYGIRPIYVYAKTSYAKQLLGMLKARFK